MWYSSSIFNQFRRLPLRWAIKQTKNSGIPYCPPISYYPTVIYRWKYISVQFYFASFTSYDAVLATLITDILV
jgi:hypothetical protein